VVFYGLLLSLAPPNRTGITVEGVGNAISYAFPLMFQTGNLVVSVLIARQHR